MPLISFAAAHASYIAALAGSRDAAIIACDPGGGSVFGVIGPVIAALVFRKERALTFPVLSYAGIISAMLATSTTSSVRSRPRPGAGSGSVARCLFVGPHLRVIPPIERDLDALVGGVLQLGSEPARVPAGILLANRGAVCLATRIIGPRW